LKESGAIALFPILLLLFISLLILGSFSALGVSVLFDARELIRSKKALVSAESSAEDMVYRTLQGTLNYTNLANQKKNSLSMNGGDASTELTVDGWTAQALDDYPKLFEMESVGSIQFRHRKTNLHFAIPDKRLAIGVPGAIQSGYLGVFFQGQKPQVIGSAGYAQGNIFSNGSVFANTGRPLVNGSVEVARHIGDVARQQHNESITAAQVTSCGASCAFTIYKDPNRIAAQSFIADTTAPIREVGIWMKKNGSPNNIVVNVVKNRRVKNAAGYPACTSADEVAGVCMDLPGSASGDVIVSDTITNAEVSSAYSFVSAVFPTPAPVIMNNKYWIIIETGCSSNGCLSGVTNWYGIAGLDDNYEYGTNTSYFCDTCPPGDRATLYLYTGTDGSSSYKAPPYPLGASNKPQKDMAFKVFLGEAETSIRSTAVNDSTTAAEGSVLAKSDGLEIIGNAVAERLYAINVGGFAYFKDLYPTNPGSGLSNESKNEVKAGGDYDNSGIFVATGHGDLTDPDIHPDLPFYLPGQTCPGTEKTYDNNGTDTSCKIYRYTADSVKHCYKRYCSCTNGTVQNGRFCRDVDNLSVTKQIPLPVESFGNYDNTIAMHFIKLEQFRKEALSMGTLVVGDSATTLYTLTGVAKSIPTTQKTLTITSPVGTRREGTMPGVLKKDMLSVTPALTEDIKFDYGVIDGNVKLTRHARLKLTGLKNNVCPFDNSTKPCYVAWIKGKLEMDESSEVTIEPPAGENPATYAASFYLLVDDNILMIQSAKIYSLGSSDANAAVLVSYSGNTNDPYAMKLNSSSGGAGSVFFAFRGVVAVNQAFEAKAIVAQGIRLDGDSVVVKFDEGLKFPNGHRGGKAVTGADISGYFEK